MLPAMPSTAFCQFDNSSADDNSIKSPNFKCIGAFEKRFKVEWNAADANGMMCTPYNDYLKQNAWLKKVFYKLDTEFIKKGK